MLINVKQFIDQKYNGNKSKFARDYHTSRQLAGAWYDSGKHYITETNDVVKMVKPSFI